MHAHRSMSGPGRRGATSCATFVEHVRSDGPADASQQETLLHVRVGSKAVILRPRKCRPLCFRQRTFDRRLEEMTASEIRMPSDGDCRHRMEACSHGEQRRGAAASNAVCCRPTSIPGGARSVNHHFERELIGAARSWRRARELSVCLKVETRTDGGGRRCSAKRQKSHASRLSR